MSASTIMILGGMVGSFILGHEWHARIWPWAKSKLASTRFGAWLASFKKG